MTYQLSYSLDMGEGQTGQTLKARLVDTDNVQVGVDQTNIAFDVGNGFYLATPTIPNGHRGGIIFLNNSNVVMFLLSVNPEEAELVATIADNVHDTGVGEFAVTVIVTDTDDTPLQAASVRIVDNNNGIAGPITTNSDGICVVSVDAGTYTVVVSKGGYTYTPGSLTVAADMNFPVEMTFVSITPSTPDQTIGYKTLVDGNGAPVEAAQITAKLVRTPEGVSGGNQTITSSSNADGFVTIELIRGATYSVRRGTGRRKSLRAPTDVDSFELPDLIG